MGLYSSDKKFYLADASSQLYRPLAYYLAKISAITPFQIVSACVFGLTVYGMAGLRPDPEAVLKSGFINTVMYLIASQVGRQSGRLFCVQVYWPPKTLGWGRGFGVFLHRLSGSLSGHRHKLQLRGGAPTSFCPLRRPQVLHGCAVIAPNQDVAFMLSILWTTVQLLLSGFFVNFPEVGGTFAFVCGRPTAVLDPTCQCLALGDGFSQAQTQTPPAHSHTGAAQPPSWVNTP
jgi:hypothetical protein